tara:strand:+ start:113 stop:520 length:408 start_codon:yes stop_codon:yes gene_type:complete
MDIGEIKKNSEEAFIFFVLYICAQDQIIDDLEIKRLKKNLLICRNIHFDKFNKTPDGVFDEVVEKIARFFNGSGIRLCNKYISDEEKEIISNLIDNQIIQELSLITAIEAASADGFHEIENIKYRYWNKLWSKHL